jgi:hypothetical protein
MDTVARVPVLTAPATSGALLLGDTVYTHTSVKGDLAPALHPLVAGFLGELPAASRERFTGRCAEAMLISDRLYQAESAAGAPLTPNQGRAAVWGGRVVVTRVGETGDPRDGTFEAPCRSCEPMLRWFGIHAATA